MHSHPNQHTEAELKLIGDMRRRNPNAGLVVFWVKLRQRGYSRSISGLYRVLRRSGQKELAKLGIRHKRIKVFTPRHNGKVERSHRKDNEYFYASHKFYSFEDFQKQLAVWERKYNHFPMRPLHWSSPAQVLSSCPNV